MRSSSRCIRNSSSLSRTQMKRAFWDGRIPAPSRKANKRVESTSTALSVSPMVSGILFISCLSGLLTIFLAHTISCGIRFSPMQQNTRYTITIVDAQDVVTFSVEFHRQDLRAIRRAIQSHFHTKFPVEQLKDN